MKNIKAGKQLDSKQLYENQKNKIAELNIIPGPKIVAAGLRSAENIGGICRLADAAGCHTLVLINESVEDLITNQKISKVARSTNKTIEIIQISVEEFIESVQSYQPLIAIELTTHSFSLFEMDLPDEFTFMIGNERHGIPDKLLDVCEQAIHIPMFGQNGSMNVSHALGICLFEWRRQIDGR